VRFRLFSGALILLIALVTGLGASAQEQVNHAGLVIRHGDGTITYAVVPFEEEEISGVELLRKSGVSLVTVSFGGLGEGVCSIDETGCSVSECRQRVCQSADPDSPYWRYFRQQDPGAWTPQMLGASSSRVADGQIDGWSWSPDEPRLPPVNLPGLAVLAGAVRLDAIVDEPVSRTIDASGRPVRDADAPGDGLAVYAGVITVLIVMSVFVVVVIVRSRAAAKAQGEEQFE
jgi:hypothetical protein